MVPSRNTKPWEEAAQQLGLAFEEIPSGSRFKRSSLAMEGYIDCYHVTVSERQWNQDQIMTVFHIDIPGVPPSLSIYRRKARLRKWGPYRKRFVLVGDREWDDQYAVKSEDPDAAILYLSQYRRQQIDAAASNFRFAVEESGIETILAEAMSKADTIVHQIRGLVEAAESVDWRT